MRTLCLGLALLAAGIAFAEGDATKDHPTLAIPRLAAPITLDGKLDDWPKSAPCVEIALDPDDPTFRGTVRAAWDADYLYLAFAVATGKGMRNAGDDPAMAYKTGDTVELFLSVNAHPLQDRLPRGPGMDTAKAGDYRVVLTMLRNVKPIIFGYDFVHPEAKASPLVVAISGPKASADCTGPVPHAEMVVRDAPVQGIPGYTVEAKIPWAYFRDYQPKPHDKLLFNLAINFANAAGTANIGKAYWTGPGHMTSDAGIEAQIHPENWGWLELLPLPAPSRFVR